MRISCRGSASGSGKIARRDRAALPLRVMRSSISVAVSWFSGDMAAARCRNDQNAITRDFEFSRGAGTSNPAPKRRTVSALPRSMFAALQGRLRAPRVFVVVCKQGLQAFAVAVGARPEGSRIKAPCIVAESRFRRPGRLRHRSEQATSPALTATTVEPARAKPVALNPGGSVLIPGR